MKKEEEPPGCIVIGRKSTKKLNHLDVLCEFLEAFAYVSYEKCAGRMSEGDDVDFGQFSYKKCANAEFRNHVDECVFLARSYILAHRLYGFEVCMVKPSEEQLVGFRVIIKNLVKFRRDMTNPTPNYNIHPKLGAVLDSIRKFGFPPKVGIELRSCKYRPRIRLLTRLRPESKRQVDTSTAPDPPHHTIPFSDSVSYSSSLLVFYAHM